MENAVAFWAVVAVLWCSGKVAGDPGKIEPGLLQRLEKGERANVLVSFVDGVQKSLDKVSSLRHNDPGQRRQAIFDTLQEDSDASQAGVLQILSARSGGDQGFQYFKRYWTSNRVFLKNATGDVVKSVAEDARVSSIKAEPMAQIPELDSPADSTAVQVSVREAGEDLIRRTLYAPQKMQVKEAWELLGTKGEGLVVGTIDTGVRYTHEALRDNFVGVNYGWYDAVDKTPEPYDEDGHGTFTMGLFVGTKPFGISPGSKWMTCKSSSVGGHSPGEALLDCIQFMACPHLPDGSNPDCSKAPAIVSNSWGSARGTEDFNEDIKVWRDMGIIPVFAIGNRGQYCNDTQSPGEMPFVIGVGNTNEDDELNAISSKGPAYDGGIKPDLVAPGERVVTCDIGHDADYRVSMGTSSACPQVAGVAALLKASRPELTYEEVYDLLTQNADAISKFEFAPKCSDEAMATVSQVPNVFFGYGRVNAFKAAQALVKMTT